MLSRNSIEIPCQSQCSFVGIHSREEELSHIYTNEQKALQEISTLLSQIKSFINEQGDLKENKKKNIEQRINTFLQEINGKLDNKTGKGLEEISDILKTNNDILDILPAKIICKMRLSRLPKEKIDAFEEEIEKISKNRIDFFRITLKKVLESKYNKKSIQMRQLKICEEYLNKQNLIPDEDDINLIIGME